MKYERLCQKCNEIQSYKTIGALNRSIRRKATCKKCSRKISWETRRSDIVKSLSRTCNFCNSIINYKNVYDASRANKSNSKCLSCNSKYIKTTEYKQKVSKSLSGENNPMYGRKVYDIWIDKYGKEEADIRKNKQSIEISKRTKGKNNPMYGKPAPIGSGNGWGGWYKGIYFRSLCELSMMYWMDIYNISWKSAERKEYTIYSDDFTYRADFIVDNILIEIKPIKLQCLSINKKKKLAAIKFCNDNNLRYKIIDPTIINLDIVYNLIESNLLIFNKRTIPKYEKYLIKFMGPQSQ